MKLLQLAAALAVTALAAVTPLSNDNAIVAGVETLARRAFLARQEAPWADARCRPCAIFELDCVKQCKDGDEECYHACYSKLCSVGPDICRTPGEQCAQALQCVDVHEGLTKASTSGPFPRDLKTATSPKARSDGDGKNREECDEFLKGCIDAFCRPPLHQGPNCEQVCRDTLCQSHAECCKAKPFIPSTGP